MKGIDISKIQESLQGLTAFVEESISNIDNSETIKQMSPEQLEFIKNSKSSLKVDLENPQESINKLFNTINNVNTSNK